MPSTPLSGVRNSWLRVPSCSAVTAPDKGGVWGAAGGVLSMTAIVAETV